MFGEVGMIIGQILSIIAVILGFITFQMKTAKWILIFQIMSAALFAAHYLLIGAPIAMALNILAVIECICYYFRLKKGGKGLFLPIFFAVLVLVISILTWDSWYSIFIMVGLVICAINLSLSDAQTIRKLNLIKTPLCFAYNLCVLSAGGMIFEFLSFVSSLIGIIKYRKNRSI